MSSHLSLTDRALIEKFISQDYTFAYIAKRLGKSPSTISREVKNHRCFILSNRYAHSDCMNYNNCLRRNLCSTETKYSCTNRCKLCSDYDCIQICPSFESYNCKLLEKPPYICLHCPKIKTCKKNHAYYSAHQADVLYRKTLRESRSGVRTSPEKLLELNELISPLILKGQSINHILSTHKDEIDLSERTIYNYIELHAFDIKNIDLPKKVKYRQRKEKKVLTKLEYQCRKGRTIEDFNAFVEANPSVPVVEMDTVKGSRGSGKVLLTMIFRETNFMLIFLLPDGTQKSVISVFDFLTEHLGLDTFKKIFPIILTDNGVEFKDANALESSQTGPQRTKIFYCDPQASWQKPHVEKNHVLIRRILPKKTSFITLTDEQVTKITCHINSVAREVLKNKTPFEMMTKKEHKKLLDILALTPIPPDEVLLKPALLKRK